MTEVACAYCGATVDLPTGHVNRSRKQGNNLYCGRVCSGRGRRVEKTVTQKKEEKRLYDIRYRERNAALLKTKKSAYYKRNHDPVKEAITRKKRMPRHVEYCRRPEYRAWKREYDRRYTAKKNYGEFWECQLLVSDINSEVSSRCSKYEIYQDNNTLGKCQIRKRDHEKSYSQKHERDTLGNPE